MEVYSYFTYNNFYKGDLNKLELFNKGLIMFKETKALDLFDKDGNFYKTHYEEKIINKESEIQIRHDSLRIVQIDYQFYLVPVPERLTIIDGRSQLKEMLSKYGISGFSFNTYFYEKHHYKFKRRMYEVFRPIEFCFCNEVRKNTKSFVDFEYKNYEENYKNALKKYPNNKDEIERLFSKNLNLICDFYEIDISILKAKNFDRLKHAIKILNKKINNNLKTK